MHRARIHDHRNGVLLLVKLHLMNVHNLEMGLRTIIDLLPRTLVFKIFSQAIMIGQEAIKAVVVDLEVITVVMADDRKVTTVGVEVAAVAKRPWSYRQPQIPS